MQENRPLSTEELKRVLQELTSQREQKAWKTILKIASNNSEARDQAKRELMPQYDAKEYPDEESRNIAEQITKILVEAEIQLLEEEMQLFLKELQIKREKEDWAGILGVTSFDFTNAGARNNAKRKYYLLMRRYHPDKHQNKSLEEVATQITKILSEANDNLLIKPSKPLVEEKESAVPSPTMDTKDSKMEESLRRMNIFIRNQEWDQLQNMLENDSDPYFISMIRMEEYTARTRQESPLLTAIQSGCDFATIKRLIQLGSNLKYQHLDIYGGMETDIFFGAVKSSSYEVVQFLYDQLYDQVYENLSEKERQGLTLEELTAEYEDYSGRCPLHFAVLRLFPKRNMQPVPLTENQLQDRLNTLHFLISHDTRRNYEYKMGRIIFDADYGKSPQYGIETWLKENLEYYAPEGAEEKLAQDKMKKAIDDTVKDALKYRDCIIEIESTLRNYRWHLNEIKTEDPLTLQKRKVVNDLLKMITEGQRVTSEKFLIQFMGALNKKSENKIDDPNKKQSPAEILGAWRMPKTKGHYALIPFKALLAVIAALPCFAFTLVGQKKIAKDIMHSLFHVRGDKVINTIKEEYNKTIKPPSKS